MQTIKEIFYRIKNLMSKKEVEATTSVSDSAQQETNYIKKEPSVKNWYQERYDNILVQRNLLFLVLLLLVIFSIVSVGVIAYIVNAKKFDPFVIQIDDTTGVAQVVNPASSNVINGNDALAQYFIKKYVIARETYNPVDFDTEARQTIRLLSTPRIFTSYRGYIRNEAVNPQVKYGQKNTTYLLLKSWSKLSDNKYIMRFSINETDGARKVYNKIAIVSFEYVAMELSEKDREINPIGFQVIDYRVDDDNS
ncbi:MAG: virB8 family protein [Rickettsiaceae bacterium]|nr:virB8 family protein [Rickettsiaceae bacterium]